MTERLQKLEDRLQSETADQAANQPHAGPVVGLSTDPATHVFLEGPAGLRFVPNPGEAPVDLPVVFLVERSVSIVLTGLSGHEKEHLTALVEVPPAARAKIASLEEAIPVKLGRTDLEAALSGKSVTYVIHQSEVDGARSFGAISSEQIDAGKDPLVEASRRGAIVAIVRLGTKLSDVCRQMTW